MASWLLDLVAAVLRHHDAVLLVVFRPPVKVIDLEFEVTVALRQRVQHLNTRGNDFGADPVARDRCYGVRLHRLVSGLRVVAWQRVGAAGCDGEFCRT